MFAPQAQTQTLAVPVTASATTIGNTFTFGPQSDRIVLISTFTGMSAGTLDMYVQEQWPGETTPTWNDVAHFAQIAANTAAFTSRVSVAMKPTSTPETVGTGGTPALAAGTFCDGPWAPLLRLVAVTGAGANAGPVTQTVQFCSWQLSH